MLLTILVSGGCSIMIFLFVAAASETIVEAAVATALGSTWE
jgi:hypothetical protein